jgi:hypothetical protein
LAEENSSSQEEEIPEARNARCLSAITASGNDFRS